ncbi:MAG: DUF3196 family protein [Ureaplasma sp.]|nr:DUF3196 family protein [Ureaplasma sp.]
MNKKENEISSLQLNDELIKYYDDLIKQIKLDFNNGLCEEAINRCEEELEQPYLPFEYIVEFEKLAHTLETEYRYKQIDDEIKQLSHHQMLNSIFDGENFNVYIFDYFLDKFNKDLENIDFDTFQIWLNHPNVENIKKFYILDCLSHYKIDRNLIFKNTNVDYDIVLNTLNFHDHEMFNPYNNTLKIIEKDLFKDPSVSKFASDLLEAVANHYFPIFPFKSSEELADIIMNLINMSMNFISIDYEKLTDDERKVYNIFIEIQNVKF